MNRTNCIHFHMPLSVTWFSTIDIHPNHVPVKKTKTYFYCFLIIIFWKGYCNTIPLTYCYILERTYQFLYEHAYNIFVVVCALTFCNALMAHYLLINETYKKPKWQKIFIHFNCFDMDVYFSLPAIFSCQL